MMILIKFFFFLDVTPQHEISKIVRIFVYLYGCRLFYSYNLLNALKMHKSDVFWNLLYSVSFDYQGEFLLFDNFVSIFFSYVAITLKQVLDHRVIC